MNDSGLVWRRWRASLSIFFFLPVSDQIEGGIHDKLIIIIVAVDIILFHVSHRDKACQIAISEAPMAAIGGATLGSVGANAHRRDLR